MKIAINGFGRIGRLVYRIMENDPFFDVVAINDLSSSEELAYLLKYDSNLRNYDEEVTYDEEGIVVEGKKVKVYAEKDPKLLPWKELGVDLVFVNLTVAAIIAALTIGGKAMGKSFAMNKSDIILYEFAKIVSIFYKG